MSLGLITNDFEDIDAERELEYVPGMYDEPEDYVPGSNLEGIPDPTDADLREIEEEDWYEGYPYDDEDEI